MTLKCRSKTHPELKPKAERLDLGLILATVLRNLKLMETYPKLGSATPSRLYTKIKLFYSVELLAILEDTK